MIAFLGRMLSGIALLVVPASVQAQTDALSPEQIEFFESRIRPVLVEQCYRCHNSIENAEGGLSVDHRAGLLEFDPMLVPGDPESSRLIAVLKHEIDGLEMPEDGGKLDDDVIRDFEKWIEMGAPDPRDEPPTAKQLSELTSWEATLQRRKQWWSFQPIRSVSVPSGEAHQPIDRFIDAKLQTVGLQRSEPAAPATLIRRLFITLTGLPPTPRQLNQWTHALETNRDDGTQQLIDALIESPQFGERWARHWMDWIRYAESHGSEGDPRIDNAWRYRDYLIRAWNKDVPYDQLVREHLAGDLLQSPRVNHELGINESIIGTAHWRMVFHGFAPTDALDEKVRFVDDQVNVFSKAFLGLTVSCARCHDHKFDAISQADYYALFGVLASCRPARQVIDLPSRQNVHRQELTELKPKIKRAVIDHWRSTDVDQLAARIRGAKDLESIRKDPLVAPLFRAWESREDSKALRDDWSETVQRFSPRKMSSSVAIHWNAKGDSDFGDWYRQGLGLQPATTDAGEFAVAVSGDRVLQGIYPSGIFSNSLTAKHAARLTSPDHAIEPNQHLWVRVIGDGEAAMRYVIQDYPRNGTVFPVHALRPDWQWRRFDLSYWSGDSMHIELATARDAPLLVKGSGRSWFGISDAVITDAARPPLQRDDALRAIVHESTQPTLDQPSTYEDCVAIYQSAVMNAMDAWANDSLRDDQAHLLNRCIRLEWLSNRIDQMPLAAKWLNEYRELEEQVPEPVRVPGLDETSGREQALYVRGSHKNPGEVVPRRFLEALDPSPFPAQQSGRRELAERLLSETNPLTRRVIVNRLWHHLFGQGLVETPDNFGRLGAKPSHPELLDWLANRLVEERWSMKQLIRQIVASQTWQQSSRPTSQSQQVDPNNRWLSHANVRRMEAEVIRDSLLAVSGQLDREKAYGPPVDGTSNRRSIYIRVIRNSLDPFLRAFDFPEPFSTTGRRDVTNVPAQSLTMMNEGQVNRIAFGLASDLLKDSTATTNDQRIDRLVQALFGRPAGEAERSLYRDYLQQIQVQNEQSSQRRVALARQIASQRTRAQQVLEPIRNRLLEDQPAPPKVDSIPDPVSRWSFDKDLTDSVGSLDGIKHGPARIEDGALVLEPGGYVTTPTTKETMVEKTLEAWVRLDDLQQRGGGVLSIQSSNGNVFDAIVFGEQQPGHWLSGSEFFRRTKALNGPTESDADQQFVHVAIVYHQDGRVEAFREGQPYGKPYRTAGPNRFPANETILAMGVRHLPAGGNRMLRGRIDEARLYNRALSADEVQASFMSGSRAITRTEILAAMSTRERERFKQIEKTLDELQSAFDALGPEPKGSAELNAWADLAHASLMMKEFIYVQ